MLLPWQIVLFELIIEETCVIISIKKQEDYQTTTNQKVRLCKETPGQSQDAAI